MKLDEYLQTKFDLSRDEYKKLSKPVRKIITKMFTDCNRKKRKTYLMTPIDYVDQSMTLDQIIKLSSRPVPKATKKELKTMDTDLNKIVDKLSKEYIDDLTHEIDNRSLDSLSLGAKIFVRKEGIPYYYDENYKYLSLDDDSDLKEFTAQELDNKLVTCDADSMGSFDFEKSTEWPFRLLLSNEKSLNPESLLMMDDFEDNCSDDYFGYVLDKLFSLQYLDVTLKPFFYRDLTDFTRQEFGSPEAFITKMKEWLENHKGKTLQDDDAPFELAEYATDMISDIDNYTNYWDELHDVVTQKIADLWNTRYLPRAKSMFADQDKVVEKQVNEVSDKLEHKYQYEIDHTTNPKLAKSLLALTLLNHIAKTLSDRHTDMTDPLMKRLAEKYDADIIYGLKDNFLHYMCKHKDEYPEMTTTVYVPEEADKYHVYFCEDHNEERRMEMLSPMEYYWENKNRIDNCADCQVEHVKNYYSFYYFNFDLGKDNQYQYHLPYPIGKSWLPKLSKFKHVHQEPEEEGPFMFGTEADTDEIMYALGHDLQKDVKTIMK